MLLGAAGGLAVGAVGGALIADALGMRTVLHEPRAQDMTDESQMTLTRSTTNSNMRPLQRRHRCMALHHPPPSMNPRIMRKVNTLMRATASRREDYEEALEAAADSSASSSDIEELEEAQEEYEEEYEEAYDD